MCTLALPLQCHSDQSRSADAHHQPQRTQYYTLSAQTLAIMPRALIRGARQMLTTNHSDDADLSSRLQNLFKVCAKDMPAPDLVHTETFALHKNALRTRPRPRCYKAKAVCPRPHIHSHRPVSPPLQPKREPSFAAVEGGPHSRKRTVCGLVQLLSTYL